MENVEYLWVEKYRPKTIEDCILPAKMKSQFEAIVKSGKLPNLILTGPAGCGKTTVAKALLNEMGFDCYIINGSMNGNIDTLRNEIMNYASSMSLDGVRKVVILDEADYLNPNSTQPALRNFMEEFSNNCGFILTCNYINKIIEPLHSRCSTIQFTIGKDDLLGLSALFLKRIDTILKKENVEYDKKIVLKFIVEHAPDWRRVLNELQRNSASGKITEETITVAKEIHIDKLIPMLRDKKFEEIRKWCGENKDISHNDVFRKIYDECYKFIDRKYLPILILSLADYQYKSAFVVDQEINLAAFLVNIMMECEFIK